MPTNGQNQIFKLHEAAESTYGETIGSPTWAVIGIVEDGEIGQKSDIKKVFGIGSQVAQAKYPGKVDNSVRVVLPAPTAAQLNRAITRTDGALDSYNFAAGVETAAWHGVGLKWNTLTLDLPEEDPLKATLDGIFKSILAATVSSAGHSPATVPIWRRDGLVLKINTVEDTDLVSCNISIKNGLTAKGVDNATTNQRRTLKYLTEGPLEIDCTIQTYAAPSFNLEADTQGCVSGDITLEATYTDVCGGGTPGTLVITLTGGAYIEKRQPLKPNDYVDYSIGLSFTDITIV